MRALVILALLATPAFADDTFEAKADGAQRIKHIDDVVWAFTAACDANNPCPAQNGQPASCNNRGICKPPAANACRP